MLATIVGFSIRYRGVILALVSALLVYGSYQLSRAGLDIFPEFSPKQVIIQTESSALSAEQVEALVTQPLENVLFGLTGLKEIRSESIQGLSLLVLNFEDTSDIYRNRQLVAERITGVSLPAGVRRPMIVPLSSSSATVMTIGVTSDSRSLMELRSLVDYTLVPQLMSVPGVADVNVFGGDVRQLQVQVYPEQLRRYDLALQDVTEATRQANQAPGFGFLETENQRISLAGSAQPLTASDIAQIVLHRSGTSDVTVGDVADIRMAAAPPISAAAVMGKPGVVLMVIGQYRANTLTVSRNIEQVLDELAESFNKEDIQLHPALFRPASYIEASLSSITGHLLIGALLVVIVLIVFLYDARAAFISAIAIPISLLSAATVLVAMGVNLNIMVMGGLAIALGEVVDDAIIDTENIFRRLRDNRSSRQPLPTSTVIFDASMEVRGSVVYATLIVALVFLPLLTLGGVAGRLFSPLAFAYILAILVSLAVALSVTPALCSVMLGRSRFRYQDPPAIAWLKPRYANLLASIGRAPRLAVSITAVLCAATVAILPLFGGTFLPELREGHYIVHTSSLPGTSLQESIRIGTQLTNNIRQIPGVRSVSQWAGRAERGADTYASHYSEYEIALEPMSGSEQARVLDQLHGLLNQFPGITYEANTFLIERVDETISGYTAPVVVNIFGHDLERLDQLAQQLTTVMRSMEGATAVQVRAPAAAPVIEIGLDWSQLARWGIRADAITEAIQIAFEGAVVGTIFEGNRTLELTVLLEPSRRRNPDDLRALPLKTADGQVILLSEVANVRQVTGRYSILHRSGRRVQTVTCGVSGRDLSSFFSELKRRALKEVDFSAESYPEFTGAAVEQARARDRLILHSVIAGLGVVVLIYIALGSLHNALLVLVNIPFSLVGGVLAALLSGGQLSVGSMVGFVTLFGITVRNSIMLVSHYRHLVELEGMPWCTDTAHRGAQERLTSILVTALVTALAMLPLAINSDNPGREIMGPMAIVIIGGLVSSTLLNLLILPTIMLWYGDVPEQASSGLDRGAGGS